MSIAVFLYAGLVVAGLLSAGLAVWGMVSAAARMEFPGWDGKDIVDVLDSQRYQDVTRRYARLMGDRDPPR